MQKDLDLVKEIINSNIKVTGTFWNITYEDLRLIPKTFVIKLFNVKDNVLKQKQNKNGKKN